MNLAAQIFANACLSVTEEGLECLHWEYPAGISNGHMEVRAILQDGKCLYAEERWIDADGGVSGWDGTNPYLSGGYPQVVTNALADLNASGINLADVVKSA